jgi:hypothetical protein
MYRNGSTNDLSLDQPLEIHIWRGNGSFDLYEDDGETDDYKNGVSTSTLSISCNDYYYTNGEISKKWDNGEVVDVGDVVKVQGNGKIWKVVGRNFRKNGVSMIDLQLREVVNVEQYRATFPTEMSVYWGKTKLSNGDFVVGGEYIHIENVEGDYEYLLINGKEVKLNQKILIDKNTKIEFGVGESFNAYYPYFTKFTFTGDTSIQEYVYNPNGYVVAGNSLTLWVSEWGSGETISLPYNGDIEFDGNIITLEANETTLKISNQSRVFAGLTGEVEGMFIVPKSQG